VNLHDLLSDAAAGLPDVERLAGPDGSVTWTRDAQGFAALSRDGSAAEFRLDAAVAAAAARTPDVSLSSRGPGWVTFRPAVLDDHGADRAAAWFASAHRRVSPG
jgi:hypothetical protein